MIDQELIFGLESEWAILAGLVILSSTSIIRTVFDYSVIKKRKKKDEKVDQVLNAIERYLRILANKYTEEITERQLPVIINEVTMHLKSEIKVMAYASVGYNESMKDPELTRQKVIQYIHNLFTDTKLALGLFKWKGTVLSDLIRPEWKDEIEQSLLILIMSPHLTQDEAVAVSQKISTCLNQNFDKYKSHMLTKAYEL